jgi:hypothetical protein
MFLRPRFFLAAIALFPLGATAADPQPGVSFSHNDWEIVCDNTRTCRAAGYSEDGAERRVSVLLTRAAGPGEAVKGQLTLGRYGEEDEAFYATLPKNIKLTLHINGRPAGRVTVPQDSLVADLPPQQLSALLTALRGKTTIEWALGDNRWPLSGAGAAAVLLKMDEFQERLHTPGALIRKGTRSEASVLPPLEPLTIKPAKLFPTRPSDKKIGADPELRKALLAHMGNDSVCAERLANPDQAIEINRLSNSKLLASTFCWLAAYNGGSGYWVINEKPPFNPDLVTDSGSEYGNGSIYTSHKGRGLGDCWSSDSWTWDGDQFVQTEASSTGMCRLMAPGGAWSLPSIVTKAR